MSISAITDKDTFHRGVSVPPQARIPYISVDGILACGGTDTSLWVVSLPVAALIHLCGWYPCLWRHWYISVDDILANDGTDPQRCISAATGKDTIHRDVSVPSLARISSTEMYQCYLKQGCFHRSISAFQQPPWSKGVPTKDTSAPGWTVSGWHLTWCPPGLSTIDSLY